MGIMQVGNVLAIGASEANSVAGLVKVYRNNTNGAWVQLGSDIVGENSQDFSASLGAVKLSSDGMILAVGAFGNDGNGSNSGHVRVFTNPTLSIASNSSYNKGVVLYPNPISAASVLDLGENYNEVNLEFFNSLGKLIKTENYENVSKIRITMQDFTSGVYFVNVKTPKKETTIRLVKK